MREHKSLFLDKGWHKKIKLEHKSFFSGQRSASKRNARTQKFINGQRLASKVYNWTKVGSKKQHYSTRINFLLPDINQSSQMDGNFDNQKKIPCCYVLS